MAISKKYNSPLSDSVNYPVQPTVIHLNPLPSIIFDLETLKILDSNDAASKKYGYSREEFSRLSIKDIKPREYVPLLLQDLKAKNPEVPFITKHFTKKGELLDVKVYSNNIIYNNTKARLAIIMDITEQQIKLKSLTESEQRFRSLFENNPDAVIAVDNLGKIKFANKPAEIVSGYKLSRLKNTSFTAYLEDSIGNEFEKQLELASMGNAASLEAKFITSDNISKTLQLSLFPVLVNYAITGAYIIAKDITQRMETEHKIKTSEERLRLMSQATNDALWDLNIVTGDIWWNVENNSVFGYTKAKVGNLDWWNSKIHPDDRERVKKSLNLAIAKKKKQWQEEYRFMNANGNYSYVIDRGSIVIDELGNALRAIGAMIDVSRLKEAEEKLRHNEANISALINTSRDYIFSLDAEKKLLTFNNTLEQGFKAYTGIDLKKGIDLFELLPDSIKEKALLNFNRALSGESFTKQSMIEFKDEILYFETLFTPIKDNENNVTGVAYFTRDITERKNWEESLQESEEKFRNLVETTYEGLVETDNKNNIVFANKRFASMLDYSLEEILNTNIKDYIPTEDFQLIEEKTSLRSKGISDQYETRLNKKNGEVIWVMISGSPIVNRNKQFVGTLGAFTDITERIRIEDKLRNINKELDQFAYIVSHDLKAPLRGINHLADWISEDLGDNLNPGIAKILNLLKTRITRMEGMINGILNYSKAGKLKAKVELVNVEGLVSEEFEMLDEKNTFKLKFDSPLPEFFTYKIKLQQIFSNLLSNAIKYHHTGRGIISVSCKENNGYYIFSVKDDGPGISPEYHSKIFEIFQTLHPRDEIESTGIGLSIVKKIVEDVKGNVWVKSEVGNGTEFFFTWPRKIKRITKL